MTLERWNRIEELYHAALERNFADRTAFLRQSCKDDPELRWEVESLLACDDEAGGFLTCPALEEAARMAVDEVSHLPGNHIGPYEIVALVGGGGMGHVYRARDPKLDRFVALKLLPASFALDTQRMHRFALEARLASGISHPNVAHIYDVGFSQGHHYIAMEFVEGDTLSARLENGALDVREALDLAVQIADALEEAHSGGIIHRDIKPSNLMITRRGRVKVLDFGLAKLAQRPEGTPPDPHTSPGTILGTSEYMSPEQALGRELDQRTDLFSLGVVLYEMVTGRRPFTGATLAETMDRILYTEPESPERINSKVPARLATIISRCLEKDRERRYPSAQELLGDLRALHKGIDSSLLSSSHSSWTANWSPSTRRRPALALSFLACVTLLTALAILVPRMPFWNSSSTRSLLVLPLQNLSGDPQKEYLVDGLTESLIANLARMGSLRVISRTSAMHYKNTRKPVPQIGSELNADVVVEGSVVHDGERVRISAQLIDVAADRHLWGESFEREARDILSLQDEVARSIAHAVKTTLDLPDEVRLPASVKVNPEAFDAYLRGRQYANRRNEESLKTAVTYFEEAIARDDRYALAYVGLSDALFALGTVIVGALPPLEALTRAEEAARRAIELDDSLGEAYTSLAVTRLYRRDWREAEEAFNRALQLNPNYAPAHSWLAVYLTAHGRFEEALNRMRRALELDPLALHIIQSLGWIHQFAGEYDLAIKHYRQVLELDENYFFARIRLSQSLLGKGLVEEANTEVERLSRIQDKSPYVQGMLARALAAVGRRAEAHAILRELMLLRSQRYVNPFILVEVHMALDFKEEALVWLEESYHQNAYGMLFLKIDSDMEPLHSDPRFQDLMRRAGF